MPIGYMRRAAQQRLQMTRRRSAYDASIRPSILWQHQRLQMTRRRSAYDASIRPSILWQHEVARDRHALVRRPDCASQHLDHPPDLRLRGNEWRRHGDGFPGKTVEHPFFHSALEYPQRAQARLALQRLELDRRRESAVADVRDARLALQRMHGLLQHRTR